MKKRICYIVCLLWCCVLSAMAQSVTVEAKIDSLQLLIGEQTQIHLTVECDPGKKVNMPIVKDTLGNGVEVVEKSPVAQKILDNGRVAYTQTLTVTAFDANNYYIPAFAAKVDGKSYQSKELALKVSTVKVDTKHPEKFYGPKDVMNPPFAWADWALVFWLSIVFLPLAGLIIYLIVRYKDQKPIIRQIFMKPKLPAHQEAMKEIDAIKQEGARLQEDPKAYYTKLTDVLRNYIRERYGFNAREMTSREIIDKLLSMKDEKGMNELRGLFQTADLVKFARYNTLINENDQNLVSAIDFINQTKEEIDPDAKPAPRVITVEEQRSRRAKALLIGGISVSVIALVAMGYAIVSRIIDLWQ